MKKPHLDMVTKNPAPERGQTKTKQTKKMTITEAKKVGIKAYQKKEGAAPKMNFVEAVCACKEHSARVLLEARLHGFTIAKLADGSPSNRPSSIELKKILNS